MNNNEQNEAIAKALGWRCLAGHDWIAPGEPFDSAYSQLLPDFTNDLNAMAIAERALTVEECYAMQGELLELMGDWNPANGPGNWVWHATAPQRREAWLKAKGLWETTTSTP